MNQAKKGLLMASDIIIPRPAIMEAGSGFFQVDAATVIAAGNNPELARIARLLAASLREITGFVLPVAESAPAGAKAILLKLVDARGPAFGESAGGGSYSLTVKEDGIVLAAPDPEGIFHGYQTILQVISPASSSPRPGAVRISGITIQDRPRFAWRGLHLDCARHFLSKDFIKLHIDQLALYRMNRLHLHLTDDQGWRIEIKKYPALTAIGAWRAGKGGARYGGFYTQADLREIVEYARERYITVIPEIEMPGHSAAALAAYPQFGCFKGTARTTGRWGIYKETFCAGREETFRFLEEVLDEVMEIFPSPYIHVGGDECLKLWWKRCPLCRDRMAREYLNNERELQGYFMRRVERHVRSRGRTIIGWDEIGDGGLPPGAIVQSWHGFKGAIAAARSCHDAILSPTKYAYFDYGLAYTGLAKAYSFEPMPRALDAEERLHILGGEACMWTEYTPQERVDSLLFPRLLAFSEALWSPAASRDFADFSARLEGHFPLLKARGVAYGAKDEPGYYRVKYYLRTVGLLISIMREDTEAARENIRLFFGIGE